MDEQKATIIKRFPQVSIVQHIDGGGTIWGSTGRWILCCDYQNDEDWRQVARFPWSWPRDLFGWSRLTARAARADKANVFLNSEGKLLGIRGGMAYGLNCDKHVVVHGETICTLRGLQRIQGDCVLHGGICCDRAGWSYFGEYFNNARRRPVRLWRAAPDLESVEVAHEFPARSIRHIHGVFRDPFDPQALWCATGDQNGECYLFRSTDRFKTYERFGDGSQSWRAVTLYFTENHVNWLTDRHTEQNFACRMKRSDSSLEVGQEITSTAWYGTHTLDGLFVSFTTVEKGAGVHSNKSYVLVSDDAFHWREVASFRKDLWRPMYLFKYGVISCPSGPMASHRFYISGEGLRALDGRSACLKLR